VCGTEREFMTWCLKELSLNHKGELFEWRLMGVFGKFCQNPRSGWDFEVKI
jgi:hypothetical protein